MWEGLDGVVDVGELGGEEDLFAEAAERGTAGFYTEADGRGLGEVSEDLFVGPAFENPLFELGALFGSQVGEDVVFARGFELKCVHKKVEKVE